MRVRLSRVLLSTVGPGDIQPPAGFRTPGYALWLYATPERG
jgi:hypothetical protein